MHYLNDFVDDEIQGFLDIKIDRLHALAEDLPTNEQEETPLTK